MVYAGVQDVEVEKEVDVLARDWDAGRSEVSRLAKSDGWSATEEGSASCVVEAAKLLEVPFVIQLNEIVLTGDSLSKGWCAKAAKVRRDGASVGIQVWHELKTVVVTLEYAANKSDEIIFVHLRANRLVNFERVADHFGARRAQRLSKTGMWREGWRLGCVSPFISLTHRHLFDLDLEKRYSHRGEVWTNVGNRRASLRFESETLISAMKKRGNGSTARVTSGGSMTLAQVDRMLKTRLVILLGNPPFLVQEYLDLWMQAQHRFLHRSEEIHLEAIPGEDRTATKRIEPDGDQWFMTSHVVVSSRGGPINQIDNPVYRRRIERHDEQALLNYGELLARESDRFPVLDVPDPSSAAYFDSHYETLTEGRMLYVSILDSVEETLVEILDPNQRPLPGFAPNCIEKARRCIVAGKRPRVFVLAGKTALRVDGAVRRRLERKFSRRVDLIFPDQHIHVLQHALEGLKKTRGSSSPGSKIKNSVRDVILDPVYKVDRRTVILRLAGEFRCLRQEKDGGRYAKGFVFVDCLEAHVYRQLSRIIRERRLVRKDISENLVSSIK